MAKAGVVCAGCGTRTTTFVPAKKLGIDKKVCGVCEPVYTANSARPPNEIRQALGDAALQRDRAVRDEARHRERAVWDQEDAKREAGEFARYREVLGGAPLEEDWELGELENDVAWHIVRQIRNSALTQEARELVADNEVLLEVVGELAENDGVTLPSEWLERYRLARERLERIEDGLMMDGFDEVDAALIQHAVALVRAKRPLGPRDIRHVTKNEEVKGAFLTLLEEEGLQVPLLS